MKTSKVAIVTGAASGIGRASAERLAADGYQVLANYRSRETEIQSLLASLPGDAHVSCKADLAEESAAELIVDSALEAFGRIDVLVNSAGVFSAHDITEVDYESWKSAWQHTVQVNLIGPMNLCYGVAKHMEKNPGGKIINITSRGAFRGEPLAPAYGATKSALNSASQSLAQVLAKKGISVYAIAPGWVDTPMAAGYLSDEVLAQSPLNRVASPEEIANIVGFLAGEGTEYLTGSIIDANGASYLRN